MGKIEQMVATCERACRAGGAELIQWRNKFSHREKSAQDLVTDADLASQRAVETAIKEEFPDHGFLGEESPDFQELDKPFCWVVDPLDGTTNYVHGFPCYGVSIAVAEEGQLVAGGVYDPVSDELFLAGLGMGASLNGQPMRCSEAKNTAESLVAVSFPPQTSTDMPDVQAFLKVAPYCRAIRRTGSAAINLAYVACGRLDAHFAFKIYPWDAAAGVVLIREAGGSVMAPDGSPFDLRQASYLTAATPDLSQDLLRTLAAEVS